MRQAKLSSDRLSGAAAVEELWLLSLELEKALLREEDSRPRVSSNTFSIRNLTAEISDDEFPSDYTNSISKQANDVQPSADEGKNHFLRKFSSVSRDHHSVDMLSKIYRLAETEVLQSSSAYNQKKETVNGGVDWENVGAEVGSQIFDQLIDDLVAELVGTL
ncbi:hypothetical protein Droror1_Dr00004216 [Drosera rotundifolia]